MPRRTNFVVLPVFRFSAGFRFKGLFPPPIEQRSGRSGKCDNTFAYPANPYIPPTPIFRSLKSLTKLKQLQVRDAAVKVDAIGDVHHRIS
jgi:hypothetical protein